MKLFTAVFTMIIITVLFGTILNKTVIIIIVNTAVNSFIIFPFLIRIQCTNGGLDNQILY
jgi:hypothetical protein